MSKLIKFFMCNTSFAAYRALIIIAYLQNYFPFSSAADKISICNSMECHKLADIYKKNINVRGKPCTDFYDYVCHGWGVNHPKPKYKDIWNVDSELSLTALKNVKKLLENTNVSTVPFVQDTKQLYRECTSLPFMGEVDSNTVKNILRTVGNWPIVLPKDSQSSKIIPWWLIENKYINMAGESSFFEHLLAADLETDFEIIVLLRLPISPYGKLKRVLPWHPDEKRHYKDFLIRLINSVVPPTSRHFMSTIDKDLDDVISFREKLRNIIIAKRTHADIQIQTIEQLQQWHNRLLSSWQTTEKIDWLATIRSMFKDSKTASGTIIGKSTKIVIQINYLEELLRTLAKTSNNIIANHVHLYFIERHSILDREMEVELKKSISASSPLTGMLRYNPERWVYCIQNNNLANTMYLMYITAHFPLSERAPVNSIVTQTSRLLGKEMAKSTWVNANTKEKWLKHLDTLDTQIGYPDYYLPGFETAKYHVSDIDPLQVDVYYTPCLNRLGVSAAYLQFPIYDLNLPYVHRYGSLMSTIAHEVYHVFDYNSLKSALNRSDEYGVWHNSSERRMYEAFEKQADCFKDRYATYRRRFMQERKISIPTSLPDTTSEDIADVMGLRLAYTGYKEELARRNGSCTILPGLPHYDCEKLFFIAFGSISCSDTDSSTESKLLAIDNHSHPRIRVNGAVANMKEFAQAFGCKPGDPLVLKETCDLWK